MSRQDDLNRLYGLFKRLEDRVGGMQRLRDCTGYMYWPERSVYFFFADDEYRGNYPRLTRVGTHAVSVGSGQSLWDRLRTHRGANRGTYEGGGTTEGRCSASAWVRR